MGGMAAGAFSGKDAVQGLIAALAYAGRYVAKKSFALQAWPRL